MKRPLHFKLDCLLSLFAILFSTVPAAAIINGLEVPNRQFRQTVALVYRGNEQTKGQIFCSGTLIGFHTVLTAAHCITLSIRNDIPRDEELLPGLFIYIGDSPPEPEIPFVIPSRKVTRFTIHPSYLRNNSSLKIRNDDLALLELNVPVSPQEFGVYPTPLAPSSSLQMGNIVTIVGFGVTVTEGGKKGLKRESTSLISAVDTYNRFELRQEQSKATLWHGDSGGSAFMIDANGRYQLVGTATAADPVYFGSFFQSFDKEIIKWIESNTSDLF